MPGGTYSVALRSVIAVSTHSYVLDAGARVTELNIDTTGSMAVRFYYIEPNVPNAPNGVGQSAIDKIGDLARQAAGRVGQEDSLGRVVKSYPATTHSRTIEYRLATPEQLDQLFKSADNAFRSGRGATIKLP